LKRSHRSTSALDLAREARLNRGDRDRDQRIHRSRFCAVLDFATNLERLLRAVRPDLHGVVEGEYGD
jgi:hypothetical protein